jgi:hypothetical protein
VYIAQIKSNTGVMKKIYPRFKDLLRVREIIDSKKIKLNLPSMCK